MLPIIHASNSPEKIAALELSFKPLLLDGLLYLCFVLALSLLSGCALPRAIGMYTLGITNSPMPPDSRRESIKTFPFVQDEEPHVDVRISSPMPPPELRSFYTNALVQRGWNQDSENPNFWQLTGEGEGEVVFRRKSKLGPWVYASETLSLLIDARDSKTPGYTDVTIRIGGDYAWDGPSKLPFHIARLFNGFGYYYWGVLFVPL